MTKTKLIPKRGLFLIFTLLFCSSLYGMKKSTKATTFIDPHLDLERITKEFAGYIADAIENKCYILADLPNRTLKGGLRRDRALEDLAAIDTTIVMMKAQWLLTITNITKPAPEDYLNQFISGAQNFGAKVMSLFRYSKEEKDLARAIIAKLEKIKNTKSDPKIIQELDKQIYEQKLISGNEMSMQKKLLIGAALITTATFAGVVLANRYFSPSNEKADIQKILTPQVSQTIAEPTSMNIEDLKDLLRNSKGDLYYTERQCTQLKQSVEIFGERMYTNREYLFLQETIKKHNDCIAKLGKKECGRLFNIASAENLWKSSYEYKIYEENKQELSSVESKIRELKNSISMLENQISHYKKP